MCAFGKWYDSFKPQNDTITFRQFWRSFDEPHQRIHALADIALNLVSQGKTDQALALIQQKRTNELAALIDLFGNAGKVIRQTCRELAVVLKMDRQLLAVSADRIDTVVHVTPDQVENLSQDQSAANNPLVRQVVRIPNSSNVRLLLAVEPLFAALAA